MNNNNDEEAFVIRSNNGVIAKLRADIEALQAHNSNLREALNIMFSETQEELEGTRRELRAMKRRELKRKRDDLQMQLVDEIIDDLPTGMNDRYIRGEWVHSDSD